MKKILEYLKETWIIWVVIIILLVIIFFTFIQPFINYSTLNELRFYVRVGLLLFLLQTFAILRMYNAVVGNTKFTIKLYNSFKGMGIKIDNLIKMLEKTKAGVNVLSDQVKKSNKLKEKEETK